MDTTPTPTTPEQDTKKDFLKKMAESLTEDVVEDTDISVGYGVDADSIGVSLDASAYGMTAEVTAEIDDDTLGDYISDLVNDELEVTPDQLEAALDYHGLEIVAVGQQTDTVSKLEQEVRQILAINKNVMESHHRSATDRAVSIIRHNVLENILRNVG